MNAKRQPPPPQPTYSFNWRYLLWAALVALFFMYWMSAMNGPPGVGLAYTEFKQALRQGAIAKGDAQGPADFRNLHGCL